MKAFIVVDLGFGDAGKGLMTDYLVRRHEAKLVVRFNGGAQAGHNVVTGDGRHHTFAQLGSGSFVPGVNTHLASPVVVHPTALRVEAERLQAHGERDVLSRVSVAPTCRVTTPYQQAAGRLRELLRAAARHGSCGVGVGETVADALATPEHTLHFAELLAPAKLRERLEAQRQQKLAELGAAATDSSAPAVARELELLRDAEVAERWLTLAAELAQSVRIASDEDALETVTAPVVLEGAQGVLLDEHVGFHPYTTYSRCTPHGAHALLASANWRFPVETLGVLRSYAVRHGPGPLPTEDARVTLATAEPHNARGAWQGAVRKGWLDLALLDYARRACGTLDALALTHLDALSTLSPFRWCEAYAAPGRLELPRCLAQQAQLTTTLFDAQPQYAAPPAAARSEQALCDALAERAGVRVKYGSVGPTARDVFERNG